MKAKSSSGKSSRSQKLDLNPPSTTISNNPLIEDGTFDLIADAVPAPVEDNLDVRQEWEEYYVDSKLLFQNHDYVVLFVCMSIGIGFFNSLMVIIVFLDYLPIL